MDRRRVLELIDSDEMRLNLDKAEKIIRDRALASQQFKQVIQNQLDRGGKRLRPLMLLLASSLNDKLATSQVNCAAAVELVHQASLLHDQVIDEDEQQTGHFILAGDYLLASGLGLAVEAKAGTGTILANCVSDMAAGQALQLTESYAADPKNAVYLKTAAQKTASLFKASCEIASKLSHLTDKQTKALIEYGHSFGLAYQIIDDYIDNDFSEKDKIKAGPVARNYMIKAEKALESFPDSKSKKSLVNLAQSYLAATLPKSG